MIIDQGWDSGMLVNKKSKIVFFAVLFLMAQLYFIVLSTNHALMNMPLTCPICTLASDYNNAITPTVYNLDSGLVFYSSFEHQSTFKPNLTLSFLSRAPPSA